MPFLLPNQERQSTEGKRTCLLIGRWSPHCIPVPLKPWSFPLGGLSWLATPALHPSFSTSTQLVGILALVYMEFFMNVLDGDAGVVTGVINGRNTVCVQR